MEKWGFTIKKEFRNVGLIFSKGKRECHEEHDKTQKITTCLEDCTEYWALKKNILKTDKI